MFRSLLHLFLAFSLLLVASKAQDGNPCDPMHLEALEENEQKWAANGIVSYTFDFGRVCYCFPEGPFAIEVEKCEIESVDLIEEVEGVEEIDVEGFRSIEGLFGQLKGLLSGCPNNGPDAFFAEYDPDLGHPTNVNVDRSFMIADEEIIYTVSNVVATETSDEGCLGVPDDGTEPPNGGPGVPDDDNATTPDDGTSTSPPNGNTTDPDDTTSNNTVACTPDACRNGTLLVPLGEVYSDGCNECTCGFDGVLDCTRIECVGCEYNGKFYEPNEPFPADDGCNECFCGEDNEVVCSEVDCNTCRVDGMFYPVGTSFSDGCNSCSCEQGGLAACTERACFGCTWKGQLYAYGECFMDGINECSCEEETGLACSDRPGCPVEWQQELDAAKALWVSSGIVSYSYELARVCECLPEYAGPFAIEVANCTVTAANLVTATERASNALPTDEIPTIDDLFTQLQEILNGCPVDRPYSYAVQFDDEYGFPMEVTIDHDVLIADEETIFYVSNVVVKETSDTGCGNATHTGDGRDTDTSGSACIRGSRSLMTTLVFVVSLFRVGF